MDQARLDCYSFGINCQCFNSFYTSASINYLNRMTKGMSRTETTGPAQAGNLGWYSDFGRASCCVTGLSLSPVTACLVCTRYSSAEKLSPLRYR
ncbi:hypothetical protein V6N13_124368 [Hibiscus sabdariffa]